MVPGSGTWRAALRRWWTNAPGKVKFGGFSSGPMNWFFLFAVMLLLAAVPSTSVALVVVRSATAGVEHGLAAAAGIVAGDLIFVLLAVLGMTALAETMGSFFVIMKMLGGAWLIWLGLDLLKRRNPSAAAPQLTSRGSTGGSFAAGLLVTLGDVKAIFFYASLFPAFVDLGTLTGPQLRLILLLTVLTVGGVKMAYALAAPAIVSRIASPRVQQGGRMAAGSVMVGAGTWMVIKA